MPIKEKSLDFDFAIRHLIDLFLVSSLILVLGVPVALAQESQNSETLKGPTQPVVAVTTTPETEQTMIQALDSYEASNSTDFLMENSPLSQDPLDSNAPAVLTQMPAPIPVQEAVPSALLDPEKVTLEKNEEVAMLVSEQCSPGDGTGTGTTSCERVYSNGHHATLLSQSANEGDETKHQTVIEEFDAGNNLLYKKTIRHRVDFNYRNDQKAKEKELFDIIYQPAGGKITRELMVYEYFLDTGKTRSLSWSQYKQIGNELKAGLIYHTLLRYGSDGNPSRGLAEQWRSGQKIETFMDWNRQSEGYASLDPESWKQWEGWIRNVSMQAYLP